jgi:hypothetical protein
MAFINGLLVDDVSGRVKMDLNQALPNPAYIAGGWLDNTSCKSMTLSRPRRS